MADRRVLFLLPLFVLMATRLVIEGSVRALPMRWAWVPAFVAYYAVIEVSVVFARRRMGVAVAPVGSVWPLPAVRRVALGVVLPAVPTTWFFWKNVPAVPGPVLLAVFAYAAVNPYFEEVFWRGLLEHLPARPVVRSLYSAFLFGFSHYFLWGAYWLAHPPRKWITAACATFVMGLLWSWFLRRDRRLIYPILSHAAVDAGNLSVALFYGVPLVTV